MRHIHGTECGHFERLLYSRRDLLGKLGGGLAGLAFADLLGQSGLLRAQSPQSMQDRSSIPMV